MTYPHDADGVALPVGPPWSVDDVADVHAGVYPPQVQAELLVRMAADPEAAAILAALNSVTDEASLLPPLPMPAAYVARLDAALSAESASRASALSQARQQPVLPTDLPRLVGASTPNPPPQTPGPGTGRPSGSQPPHAVGGPAGPSSSGFAGGTVVSLDQVRANRRRRGWILGTGIAAAAAAVAVITVTALNGGKGPATAGSAQVNSSSSSSEISSTTVSSTTVSSTTTTSTQRPPAPGGANTGGTDNTAGNIGPAQTPSTKLGIQSPNALTIDPANLQETFNQVNGRDSDLSKFSNPLVYASCLAANDVEQPDVLGLRLGTLGGKPAFAIAVAIPGDPAHANLVVVGAECGANGADRLIAPTRVNR